jgi:L-threonylcarbamoyladenylate synthase
VKATTNDSATIPLPVVDDRVNGVEKVRVSPTDPEPGVLARAAGILSGGGLVIFPTDTLYGIAADPRHSGGVARVYQAKGRPAGQALPLIAADLAQVELCATSLSAATRLLAGRFWPGPLTLVVEAAHSIVPGVHGETGGVAVRVPNHAVARALARRLGFPVVATSANRSGQPASRLADLACAALEGEVDLVLDCGPTPGGAPSTIVDVRGEAPLLIRAGAIPYSLVLEAL